MPKGDAHNAWKALFDKYKLDYGAIMEELNYNRLFIDMDSFYASIEQQDNLSYVNKPLIVVPCKTDYTCAISASLEAKKLGIKTGTSVLQAKAKCFDIIVVEARPMRYVEMHNKLVKILNNHLHGVKVLSIDEKGVWSSSVS